jgi:hypothetical protein
VLNDTSGCDLGHKQKYLYTGSRVECQIEAGSAEGQKVDWTCLDYLTMQH